MCEQELPFRTHKHSSTAAVTIALLAVIAVSAIVRIWLAVQNDLNYDSAWHVFVARQSSWHDFWREVDANAHPPLYYLTLIAAFKLFGESLLAYRVVSIVAALVSTWLLARITARLTSSAWTGVAAAGAFGLSFTAIDVSLEVRAYALAVAFTLVAFGAYVDWINTPSAIRARTRVLFTSGMAAAILTHYSSFFFLAAALSTPIVLACVDRSWRKRLVDDVRTHPVALTLMLLTPVAVAVVSYQTHAGRWSRLIGHVAPFLYASGREPLMSFLTRTTREFFELLVPTLGFNRAPVIAIGLLLGALCIVAMRRARSSLAVVPFVFVAVMIPLNILTAVAGRYPYGGELRHEFFLFPFLIICLFIAIESARRRLQTPWASRPLWTVAGGLVIIANSVAAVSSFPSHLSQLASVVSHPVETFRAVAGTPPTVLTGQFGLIIFFIQHNEWQWRRTSEDVARSMWQVWDLRTTGSGVKVCRSRQWQLDFSNADTYQELTDCFKHTGASRVAVFSPHFLEPPWGRQDIQSLTIEFARREGLYPTRLITDFEGVFGTFQHAPLP